MILGWPLAFLWKDQIFIPMHLYGENTDSYGQNIRGVLMEESWGCYWSIKVFSYYQNFTLLELCSLMLGLYTCIESWNTCMLVFSFDFFNEAMHIGPVVNILSHTLSLIKLKERKYVQVVPVHWSTYTIFLWV